MVARVNNLTYGVIEPGDGDDMAGAGFFEGFLHRFGNTGLDAEQDAGQEGGFGVGPELEDGLQGARLEGEDASHEGVALAGFEHPQAAAGHVTVDALPGEIVSIGKGLVFGGCLKLPAQHDPVAVAKLFLGSDPRQHQAVDWCADHRAIGAQAFGFEADIRIGVASVGEGGHHSGNGHLPHGVVVVGDELGVG